MNCIIDIEMKNVNVIKYFDCNISVTLKDPECRSILSTVNPDDKYILLCIFSDGMKIILIKDEFSNLDNNKFSHYLWEFPRDISNIKG